MFPMRRFIGRFEEILEALDALGEASDGDAAEALEDLNAELEDALMLLLELKPEDDGEELREALEDVSALAGDYRALAKRIDGLDELAEQLKLATEMALANAGE